jgi:hypothetical protein
MKLFKYAIVLITVCVSVSFAASAEVQLIGWDVLIPQDQRSHYQPGPPPAQHDYLLGEASLAALQPTDFSMNMKLNGQHIKIAGFIVPLDIDHHGNATEFFLVPYYGACIHVPPPAPNQMIDVHYPKGLKLAALTAAYWVSGTVTVGTIQSKLGASVYRMDATVIEDYRY